jgi:predicted ABC-type ATPase
MERNLYIIAGPNGAGKTTFARRFLPTYVRCPIFVNADYIAATIAPSAPESAAFQAGRLMLHEIKLHVKRRDDFGFETTLSGLSYLPFLKDIKNRGYHLHFYYLWVPSVDLALQRIEARVSEGGHDIPEIDVRRRYGRSIRNFLIHYRRLADSWVLFDNSGPEPTSIAIQTVGSLLAIEDQTSYDKIIATHFK